VQTIHQCPTHWQDYFWKFADELYDEILDLENRVNALSEEMLAGRDRYQPITDGEFQGLMNQLREFVKNLSRDISKAVSVQKNEFRDTLEGNLLTNNLCQELCDDRSNRRYLIQSAIWKVLIDELFHNSFQVHGEEGEKLGITWNGLFSEGRSCHFR
jgi:hypothetical protein